MEQYDVNDSRNSFRNQIYNEIEKRIKSMSTVEKLIEDVTSVMQVYCLSDVVNLHFVLGPWRIYKMRHDSKRDSSMERRS